MAPFQLNNLASQFSSWLLAAWICFEISAFKISGWEQAKAGHPNGLLLHLKTAPASLSRTSVFRILPLGNPCNCSSSGGILVGRGASDPPPPPSGKWTNFRKFWSKRGLKTVFSSANGGVCRKFESFVGNLGGFAPPPEKVNFRHCAVARL
jgi:hypothetical protein